MAEQKWPQQLWLVRHGQSEGNVARDAAESAGLPLIDIATRDVDTPLSALGMRQAAALGQWFARLPSSQQPTVVLSSPYLRAVTTGRIALDALGGTSPACIVDERLREKEFGILDRLTKLGIQQKYPELSEQRAHVGKFYFRPPGGESWCDVILRLRNMLETIIREYRGERVLVIGHQVIIHCFRYLLERLDEQQILAIDQVSDVPNCAVTSYEFDPALAKNGKLVLRLVNFVAPLQETGTPITVEPDVSAGPKS